MKPQFALAAAACLLLPLFVTAQDDPPAWPILSAAADSDPFPNTKPLDWDGDLASRMVDGIDEFLLKEIEASVDRRDAAGKPDRDKLAAMLGVSRDARPEKPNLEFVDWTAGPRAEGKGFVVRQVRWNAFRDVHGIGLLFEPEGEAVANVIVIPDAGQTPEEIAKLPPFADSASATNPAAAHLANLGCRVLVPMLISRDDHEKFSMSNREWVHRSAYMLGRTLVGYEVQKVLAGVDCLLELRGDSKSEIAVVGWGEGGRIALYAAALDERISSTCISGYFGERQGVWDEPADRTVFGLLNELGDAEIASLIAPRELLIEHTSAPNYVFRPDENGIPERLSERGKKAGKPGKLIEPTAEEAQAEFARLQKILGAKPDSASLVESELPLAHSTLISFLGSVRADAGQRADSIYTAVHDDFGPHDPIADRHAAQLHEIDDHNQWALIDGNRVRAELFKDLKTDSLENFEADIERYRDQFRDEVVGKFDQQLLAANPRSRKYQEGPKTTSYEVVLDVFPGVFAYGVLTLPKDLDVAGGEKRPVVVCQHGLEGRPQDVIGEEGHKHYSAFATRLAERGFVTFAPQNIYIFHDRFRTLQFKANAVGCTLFSVMVPQHEQITGWLAELPFVDPDRIAFYGLSYGGKSAMRLPPLVDRYCLSICSADFNEWVWKNAATDPKSARYTYAGKGEYEIFEFNLGNTFNYAEMAALICPRPFMVERGHFDGVAPDETVAYEFAKVRHLYQAKLGIGDRAEIEWFAGPHSINGVGTYEFLHKHLNWPKPKD
ncbi:MAG: dienelactone hydrolase [Verrucomicrobiales bacterium]|jgi:dienelactone hydrolase